MKCYTSPPFRAASIQATRRYAFDYRSQNLDQGLFHECTSDICWRRNNGSNGALWDPRSFSSVFDIQSRVIKALLLCV